jgi:hypothetical protein
MPPRNPRERQPAAEKPAGQLDTHDQDEKRGDEPEAEQRAEKPADVETRDGICVRCWPNGWPSEDTKSASCEHGTWQR